MATFYEQEMLQLFERYDLSPSAKTLLKAFDNFKSCQIDGDALGRQVRLSSTNRSTLINTMLKCANFMKECPAESKHCVTIISICGEILETADKQPREVGFHGFAKLPREIRERVYDLYLGNRPGAPAVIQRQGAAGCNCPPHEAPQYEEFERIENKLGLTSKAMSQEVFAALYRKRTFHFACACEMGHHLRKNQMLRSLVRNLKFHWCGEMADKGIREIHVMPQLEHLTIYISKATTKNLLHREEEIRKYFGPRRATNVTGVYEGLGWDELIAIRGLKRVIVEHADKRKADRRTDAERAGLEYMLKDYCVDRTGTFHH